MARKTVRADEWLFGRFRRRFSKRQWAALFGGHPIPLGGAAVDTTKPTCAITSTASVITAGAFTCTFTFSEDVTGFALGDITVSANAGAGTFVTVSASVYTAVITPTAAGTVTVDVAAGVCADAAGNTNTAATQFSILSAYGATAWYDFSDITTLFQNTALTTPVTADGQSCYIKDKSGSNNHLNGGTPPVYKVNIIGTKSAALFTAASSQYLISAADAITNAAYTVITADQTTLANTSCLWGAAGLSAGLANQASATGFSLAANNIAHNAITYNANNLWMVTYDPASTTGKVKHNGYATWATKTDVASFTPTIRVHWARRESGPFWGGYAYERFVFPGVLSDTVINAFRDYINVKWSAAFF